MGAYSNSVAVTSTEGGRRKHFDSYRTGCRLPQVAREFSARLDERTRIARELHDTLPEFQGLIGAGAAALMAESAPDIRRDVAALASAHRGHVAAWLVTTRRRPHVEQKSTASQSTGSMPISGAERGSPGGDDSRRPRSSPQSGTLRVRGPLLFLGFCWPWERKSVVPGVGDAFGT